MTRHTVAIVGAGYSGTMVALHLLRQPNAPHVVLLEREHPAGRGTAYSTPNLNHRLNVPAGRMSAFADEPDDFLEWLNASGHGGQPDDFVPRWLFGCYIRQRLEEATGRSPDRLDVVGDDVQAVAVGAAGGVIQLGSGRRIRADQIVLATGNARPKRLPMADDAFIDSPFYRGDPWTSDALAGLDPGAAVLLVGTGLTMIDVVVSLLDAGHHGPIQAISRRGLVPHTHASTQQAAAPLAEEFPDSFSDQLHYLRREARAAASRGLPWQSVMDSVRPRVQEIWRRACEAERSRFLRHARPWWDIHRHRIAPAVAARIDGARMSGQLKIAAGRIGALVAGTEAAEISYTPRRGSAPVRMHAARVINCTGPADDVARSDDPLFRSLLSQGLAGPDALHLGLHVSQRGEVLRPDGTVSPTLYAVGPLTKGTWWEITSVPDIRQACARLGVQLCQAIAANASSRDHTLGVA